MSVVFLVLPLLGLVAWLAWKLRGQSRRIGEMEVKYQELLRKLRDAGEHRASLDLRIARADELNRELGRSLAGAEARGRCSEGKLRRYEHLPKLLNEATAADLDYFFRRAAAEPDPVSVESLLAHLESVASSHASTAPATQKTAPPPRAFQPSAYQEDIFAWIERGSGDAIIHAVAGSGKTTTLVEASKLIGTDRALFLAFNRSIAEELGKRLERMRAKTIHSLGLQLVRKHLKLQARGGDDKYKDPFKYTRLTREYFKGRGFDDKKVRLFERETVELLNFARLTLTDRHDEQALLGLIARLAIAIDAAHVEPCVRAVAPILDEGIDRARESVDFTDMVWLPNVFDVTGAAAYEWIFVDEAQDLNAAQRQLVLKSRAAGGRILFVGDPRQAIYGFAGADSRSMQQIAAATGARDLPLSVSYRCPASHVELARSIVPQIEPAPGAARGLITRPSVHQALGQMRPGDLVISRCSAPLAGVYAELRKAGVPAYLVGEDLKEPLLRIVRKIRMRRGFKFSDFPDLLDAYAEEQAEALRKTHPEPEVAEIELRDRVFTVKAVYSAAMPATADALMEAIERMYARQDEAGAVRCSTIHRAKGLESERVFLVAPELLPHPKATKDWQREQEENLRYVAYTRSKYFLAICQGEL